jgi:glycogen(starch) synthase
MPHDTPSRRPPAPFESTQSGELPLEVLAATPREAFLFEVAWEVCNQVGGIYQVLRSKAELLVERWREEYCLVGPYVESKARLEFEPTPRTGFTGRVADELDARGIPVHHGRWLIPGKPRVLLLSHGMTKPQLAEAKYFLWKNHNIRVPDNEPLVDGAVTFAEAVTTLLEIAANDPGDASGKGPRQIVAHFHEWQGGTAVPIVRRRNLKVAAVFTTHATQLGRYIASNELGFYERLSSIDHLQKAAQYNVQAQHEIERAAAHGAHVFTTVSQITAEECSALLGRTPDVVTPNGLNIARYNVGHDFQTFHADFKERLHAFTMGHFFPSYSFDLDKTLYMFTSGRFEPRNKGFDVCLEAMARLNWEIREAGLDITVVFFIVTSRPTRSIHPLVLEKRGVLNELRGVCANIVDRVGNQLFRRAAEGQKPVLDELVDEYWQLRFRRTQSAFRRNALPPVVTHILEDDHTDPVLAQIRQLGLINMADHPVKVIYHPEFVTPENPLWGIDYDQFVRGSHLGLFPSAYEPWGYTPLECMALGVPAISSDLAGFGRYVQETQPGHDNWGLTVLPRRNRGYHEAATDLAQRLLAYCRLSRRDRVNLRNEVEKRSWEFDWQRLGVAYHAAHDMALDRARSEFT